MYLLNFYYGVQESDFKRKGGDAMIKRKQEQQTRH